MSVLGLPKIEVWFKQLVASIINRSAKGIVCLIIKDDTDKTFSQKSYSDAGAVLLDVAKYTEPNYNAIYDAFLGTPSKVIVIRVDIADQLSDALAIAQYQTFNYLAYIDSTLADQDALVVWTKAQNLTRFKRIKAVTYKATAPDDEHVINFINDNVKRIADGAQIAGHLYLGRLAGLLAGLPMTQSSTYFKLVDLESLTEVADVGASIGLGKLVLINLEGSIVIARGVNSLQTIANNDKTDDWKFIAIIEAMDLIYEDVKTTFRDEYVGKYKNNASNQTLLISSINQYFRDLAKELILDDGYENTTFIDTEAMREAWAALGKDVTSKTDEEVRKLTIGTDVYVGGDIKVLNAIEGLKFSISMV